MGETRYEIIQASRSIGAQIAAIVTGDVDYARSYGEESANEAERLVDSIADRIEDSDPELKFDPVSGDADRELGKLLSPFVDRFLKVFRREDFRQIHNLPLLLVGPNALHLTVPIDAGNHRATNSIAAMIRARSSNPGLDRSFEFDEREDADQWQTIARLAPFVELRPHEEAATNFFSLFTLSFWFARRSINSSRSPATINFTVDCATNGYQLEYWPQFLFSPMVFGAKLTRPVSAVIPVNYYHFLGWIRGTVKPDGGLYVADPNNTAAMLRAF